MTITHFESPGDLARACRKMHEAGTRDASHFPDSPSLWLGNESFSQMLDYAERGNDAYVKDAESMLEKIRADLIEIPRPEWQASVAGAFPSVPDFLAGHPDNMRRKVNENSDRAPVRIYVCTTSSGGIPAKVLKARGTAILALVMALTPIRPVELYAFSILGSNLDGESVACTRIPTETLHLGIAANALCGQGWARGLNYGWQQNSKHNANGGWPRQYEYGDRNSRYVAQLVRRMGGTDRNLHIPPAELGDAIVREPIRWVNERLAEYASGDLDEPTPQTEAAAATTATAKSGTAGREMPSRFPGKCKTCGASFDAGALITYAKEKGGVIACPSCRK